MSAPQNAEFWASQAQEYRDLIQFAAANWDDFESCMQAKFGLHPDLNDYLIDAGVVSVEVFGYVFEVQPAPEPEVEVELVGVQASTWY